MHEALAGHYGVVLQSTSMLEIDWSFSVQEAICFGQRTEGLNGLR